jgi:N-acetylglucosamine-6-phosphate deacetylase
MQVIAAKYLFDGETLLENKALIIDNNLIQKIIDINLATSLNYNYLGDGIIAPGFIDLQLNGCGGVLFNETTDMPTLETMYQTCLRFGTTSFLPTLITSDINTVTLALNTVKEWFATYGNTRGGIGIHLEGPFIAKDKKGIHSEEHIIKPEDKLLALVTQYVKHFPIKMTIAVETFTEAQIKFLYNAGIILSIGHSNANYAQAVKAIQCGITTATHVFNAMSGLTARNPGVIGAILNNNIYAGVIADLLHVDAANIELLYKLKPDKLYLVTDSVTPMGTKLTKFMLAGKELSVKDGKCIDENNVLGGANLTMNNAIKNCVEECHIPLPQALKMASLIPAQVMHLDNTLGKIKPNYRADLVYLEPNNYECTIVRST